MTRCGQEKRLQLFGRLGLAFRPRNTSGPGRMCKQSNVPGDNSESLRFLQCRVDHLMDLHHTLSSQRPSIPGRMKHPLVETVQMVGLQSTDRYLPHRGEDMALHRLHSASIARAEEFSLS